MSKQKKPPKISTALVVVVILIVGIIGGSGGNGKKKTDATSAENVLLLLADEGIAINFDTAVSYNKYSDPNELLGLSGEYTSKVNFFDSQYPGSSDESNSVEVFANKKDATKRRKYLKSLYDDPVLPLKEYTYQRDNVLLRIMHIVPKTEAKKYKKTFEKIKIKKRSPSKITIASAHLSSSPEPAGSPEPLTLKPVTRTDAEDACISFFADTVTAATNEIPWGVGSENGMTVDSSGFNEETGIGRVTAFYKLLDAPHTGVTMSIGLSFNQGWAIADELLINGAAQEISADAKQPMSVWLLLDSNYQPSAADPTAPPLEAFETPPALALADIATPETSLTETSTESSQGSVTYLAGSDIPAGVYYISAASSSPCSFRIESDLSGSEDCLLCREDVPGSSYVDLRDGRYLTVENGSLLPVADVQKPEPDADGYYSEGKYRVGIDIPAGDYKAEVLSSGAPAYYCRLSDANKLSANIISESDFVEYIYMSPVDAEYLYVKGARFKPETRPAPAPAPTQEQEDEDDSSLVYITPSGKSYHRENCATLKRSKNASSASRSSVGGRSACKVCKP